MYYQDDNSLLSRLERKIGRFAVPNLAFILVIAMALVYLADYTMALREMPLFSNFLYFDRALILKGQVWRIFTFTIVPEFESPIFVLLSLYFFWFIGSIIEKEWGSFKFNTFYLMGYLGSVASGFIMGYTTNYYLNLSLFLAFAILNAEAKVLLFFFIPIKVKWLAYIDLAILILEFIISGWTMRVALLFSLANVILFFWKNLYYRVSSYFRRRRFKVAYDRGYHEFEKKERKRQKKAKKVKVKDLPSNENNSNDDLFGF